MSRLGNEDDGGSGVCVAERLFWFGALTLEAPEGAAAEIARYDTATADRTVLVGGDALLAPGTSERLSVHGFRLSPSGRTLLLFNNASGSGGVRTPMTAATSPDGGRSWTVSRNLQVHDDNDTKAVEFSYPSVLQTPDGTIHAAYTYNRQTIKYLSFAEGWL